MSKVYTECAVTAKAPAEATNEICMSNGIDWAVKISAEGIKFNRERWPHYTPQDFATEFMDILEQCTNVNFNRVEEKTWEGPFEIKED